jgi:regulatory protein
VEATVSQLREHHLVDDEAFAQYWVDQRQTFRPRGARLLQAELRQHGVDGASAVAATDAVYDSAQEDAYRAAERRARQFRALDERAFKHRLGQFLARRGFAWETVASVVERLWREVSAQ